MLGKRLTVKETNHKAKIVLLAGGITLLLSFLLFLISQITASGIKDPQKKKKTRETESNDIVLYDPDK